MKKIKLKEVPKGTNRFRKFLAGILLLFAVSIVLGYGVWGKQHKKESVIPSDRQTSSVISPTVITAYPTVVYDYSPTDWEKDAYLIAQTFSDGTEATGIASAEVYASHNTTDVLVHYDHCCGRISQGVVHWNHAIISQDYAQQNSFYTTNYYDDVLATASLLSRIPITKNDFTPQPDLVAESNSDGTSPPNFSYTYTNFSFSGKNYTAPKIINNWPNNMEHMTINGITFPADRQTIQISRSTKGIVYNIIYSSEKESKVAAILTISEAGDLVSFKTY